MKEPRFDIWPVLEHYGWKLPHPRGGWQPVKCIEHGDQHASAGISKDAGQIKCMACDFGGDAITIVRHYEGLGYRDAVRRCEELTGTSDGNLLRAGSRNRGLPSRSRNNRRGGTYTPPRLRGRTDDRT